MSATLGTIGMARIEAWLMPWVSVFLALTLAEIARVAEGRGLLANVSVPFRNAVVGVLAVALAIGAVRCTTHYPTTRARSAFATLARTERSGVAYIVDGNFPVDLGAPGPIRVVEDHHSTTGFDVVPSRPVHVLHLDNVVRAAGELRLACSGTAAIAGANARSIAAVLARVGCPVLQEQVNSRGTPSTFDDTVVLSFGPRGSL